MSNHILYGEMHTRAERDRIERAIRKEHALDPFKYLLTEEAGPYRYYQPIAIRQAIKGTMFSISDRSFNLGLELGIPVIGIDDWNDATYAQDKKGPRGVYLDCRNSFRIRERKMVSVTNEFLPKGRVALIVGDSHLRQQRNLVMGETSPLYTTFANRADVTIIRSNHGEVK